MVSGWVVFRTYWGCLIKRHIELTVATYFPDTFRLKLGPSGITLDAADGNEWMYELDEPKCTECNHTNWHFDKRTMLQNIV